MKRSVTALALLTLSALGCDPADRAEHPQTTTTVDSAAAILDNANQLVSLVADRGTLTVRPMLDSEQWRLRVRTSAVFRGVPSPPAAVVDRAVTSGRIELRRGAMVEYFDNRPDGIEHGWIFDQRPAGLGPLQIDVTFEGLQPQAVSGRKDTIVLARGSDRFMRYHSLRAWDSNGDPLEARMQLASASSVRIVVDDSQAVYPITVDPTLSRISQASGSDSASGDELGASVAVDGPRAVVGAPGHNSETGAVYVFENMGGSWSEITKLTASDGVPGDRFGESVAIVGGTVLIGAPGVDGLGTDRGGAYIFEEAGVLYNQIAKLEAVNASDSGRSGATVVLGTDDLTDPANPYLVAFLGAPTDDAASNDAGAVFPFSQRNDGTWEPQLVFGSPVASAGAQFGASIAFDPATLEVFVGEPGYDGPATDSGGAHRYLLTPDPVDPDFIRFAPVSSITASVTATGDEYGASLGYASGVLSVGAPGHGASGALFRHGRNTDGVDQFGFVNRLVDGGLTAGSRLGAAVYNGGNIIVGGAPNDGAGSAVFFGRDEGGAGNWGVISRLGSPTGSAGDLFATSVAMQATLVVGAPAESATGQAHFYALAGDIVASDDVYTVEQGATLSLAGPGVLANDIDPEGDPLTAVLDTPVTSGNLSLSANGGFTYTATSVGDATFTYTATDGTASSPPATVTITVTPTNQPPVANDDFATTDRDTLVAISVLANDSDPDGDPLTLDSVNDPPNGTANVVGTTVEYTPDAGFSGQDTFTYTVSADGGFDTALVTVSVTATNQPPVANQDTVTTGENMAVNIQPLANDTDPENDTLSLDSVDDPANGTITVNGSVVSYTPDAGFSGFDLFNYRVSDGQGNLSEGTIRVAVSAVTDPPTANDDTATTDENSPVLIDVLANDTDPDSALGIAQVGVAANGMTRVIGGFIEYTPNTNFVGTDQFTYTVTDGGLFDQATVTITVIDVNLAPVFEAPTPLSTIRDTAGNTISFRVYASDGDGDTVTYNLQNPPSGTMLDAATGNFVWMTTGANQGTNQLVFEATDGTAVSTANVIIELSFTDDDGDGLSDDWESDNGLDPTNPDTDGDTISDGDEVGLDLDNPHDSDGDGVLDALESDSDDDGYLDAEEAGDADIDTPPRDTDGDGIPDFQDIDSDDDGVLDERDNCLLVINDLQEDLDGDGQGDVCDVDLDGDGLLNATEPLLGLDEANPDSDFDNISDGEEIGSVADPINTDGDDKIDALDTDSDDDGVDDIDEAGDDDLSTRAIDTDGDGIPDYRDPDSDNDGIDDGEDNCRFVPNASQSDADGDGIGDLCDAPPETDDDGDGVDNDVDNCPEVPNATQADVDGDGLGDDCDDDDDNDMVPDADDNCPRDENPDQADVDEDGVGDACDPDSDNDGVNDDVDNCPNEANPDQADEDDDGDGDACDAPVDNPPGDEPPDEGCCRVVKNRPATSGWGVLILMGLLLGWRRQLR